MAISANEMSILADQDGFWVSRSISKLDCAYAQAELGEVIYIDALIRRKW